jgi:hypothetical protein
MLDNFIQALKKHINDNGEKVSPSAQLIRYNTCVQCPYFRNLTQQCKKCGCFVNLKTWWKSESCPIGKW